MSRWEPNAGERLSRAALDLYAARGYDKTTVGDVAAHAGVTSRTYFRYFPDKKEVLFGGADRLREQIKNSLLDASTHMSPMTAALHAIGTCDHMFQADDLKYLRQRDAVISSSSELRERESRKLASIAATVADGLIQRGSNPVEANLVADIAIVIFKLASHLWMDEPSVSLSLHLNRAAAQAQVVLSVPL